MTGEGNEESGEVLAEHTLAREGLEVKLDRGFAEGTYCLYIEFPDLASRVGFSAAHRRAAEYCALLKAQLERFAGHSVGETEDASRAAGPRRRRDLELTYLTFPVVTPDGRFHDDAIKERFRIASLRAGQALDQSQARAKSHRHHAREERFRRQLVALLSSEVYAGLDGTVKDRLVDDVTALAFPSRGLGA